MPRRVQVDVILRSDSLPPTFELDLLMDATPATDRTAPFSPAEVRTIIVGVMLAMFLAALDQTIVAPALPTIGRELGNFADLSWVVTGYLLAATAVALLYGKLSDIHGRRITALVGISTFVLGSVASALARDIYILIIARVVQGLGGGGLITIAQTVVADIIAPRERGRYQAYFAAVFASSSLVGPLLGGLIAEYLHWSVIFWINLPIGIVAFAINSNTLKRLPRHERRHRLDVLGTITIVAASVSLMLALSWAGEQHSWSSPEMLGLLTTSVLLWAFFVARQLTAEEPLIPRTVLRNGVVRSGTASSCFGMGTLIGLTVFLPIFFEAKLGLTAGQSGLALIPLTVGVVVGATFAGRSMSRVTHYKRLPLVGLAVATTGCLGLALIGEIMPIIVLEATLAVISVAMGTMLPVTTVAVQNAVAQNELGVTTASIGFLRQLGGALMVAALGAIVLGGRSLSSEWAASAVPAETGQFRWMFFAGAAGFLLAFVMLLLMKELPLRGSAAPQERPLDSKR
jgi:EmrB/QacA subfamily drug resistance transporter